MSSGGEAFFGIYSRYKKHGEVIKQKSYGSSKATARRLANMAARREGRLEEALTNLADAAGVGANNSAVSKSHRTPIS